MSEDDDEAPLTELASGFRKRTLATAKLAAKLGVRCAKHAVGASPAVDAARTRAAEELAKEMGRMKGLVMKLGQIASYMPGASSPEGQAVLARLQSKSTAMAPEKVAEVVRAELGDAPEALFDRWDRMPAASASIGQVHRASWGGREVAVKVQYPGIEDLVRSDLDTIGMLTKVSTFGTNVDGGALADELCARILEECDYRLEAERQALFCELLAHDGASVPAVIPARSSRRVLTTTWAEGSGIRDFVSRAPARERDRAGEIVFATCFDTLMGACVYNGDPHPGNYLFADDGSVTFLDFGCVRAFSPELIDHWKRLQLAMLDGRFAVVKEQLVTLGLAPSRDRLGARFDWEHQERVMEYLYRPFKAKEPFTYTEAYVRESYDLLVLKSPNQRSSGMPAEWLLLNRLQWGLNSVLAQLGATARWGEHFRRAAESPTRPVRPPSPVTA
jgi:predicted unusual protein kinase regulating ubiquinone biosynthesis (AarF/ABC1/UbiB family)